MAAGVGTVTLLQDHNGISHVAVRKVNPEVGPVGSPPPGHHVTGHQMCVTAAVKVNW